MREIRHVDKVTGSVAFYTVPCGKCYECREIARGQLASKSVIQANKSSSLFLCTLTYNNKSVPIKLVEYIVQDGVVLHQSEPFDLPDSINRSELVEKMKNPKRKNSLRPVVVDSCYIDESENIRFMYEATPSLNRKDFSLWLKRCRVQYLRDTGEVFPSFSYLCFGEYGDLTSRPHMHFLAYGLRFDHIAYLADKWQKKFGHFDYRFVNRLNPDGSPGFVKAAKYISKYIGKQKFALNGSLEGYVEKPRRISSRGFGRLSDEDFAKLRPYYLAFDVNGGEYNPANLSGLSSDEKVRNQVFDEILKRRSRLVLDGAPMILPYDESRKFFGIPTKKRKTVFYESCKGLRTSTYFINTYRQSALQFALKEFAVLRDCEMFMGQLRKYSCIESDSFNYANFQKLKNAADNVLEVRESSAEKRYLKSLIVQSYA